MKAIIVGYGKMGEEIEKILLQRGHTIMARIDPQRTGSNPPVQNHLEAVSLKGADVAIEFSVGSAVQENLACYLKHGIPSVIGTTGWSMPAAELRDHIEKARGSCIIGTNFSVGAHIFFRLVEQAARIIGNLPQYDIMLHEIHHAGKIDSPSGTARSAAQRIIAHHPVKTQIVNDNLQRPIRREELHVSSLRGGTIHGTHRAIIDAPEDTIEISHNARSRAGFALGAVLAAEWIISHSGLHTMESFMNELIGGHCTCS